MVNRVAEQNHRIDSHHPNCVGCQMRMKVVGFNGAEKAIGVARDGNKTKDATEVFKNLRSQGYWNLRERLNPANPENTLIGLPRNSDLAAQLSCIKWRTGSDGRKEVEPKIGLSLNKGGTANWGIKRRLGFSPDLADATMYVVWGLDRVAGQVFAGVGGSTAKPQVQGDERFKTASLPDSGIFMDGVMVGGGLDGVE